jgi:hypothetical protein
LHRRRREISDDAQDVDWHSENNWMFGSAGDDRKIMVYV